jgi:hypothetical protein
MAMNALEKIIKVATELDKRGLYKMANELDVMIKRIVASNDDFGLSDALRKGNRTAVMIALESINSGLPESMSITDALGMSQAEFGEFMGSVYRGDMSKAKSMYLGESEAAEAPAAYAPRPSSKQRSTITYNPYDEYSYTSTEDPITVEIDDEEFISKIQKEEPKPKGRRLRKKDLMPEDTPKKEEPKSKKSPEGKKRYRKEDLLPKVEKEKVEKPKPKAKSDLILRTYTDTKGTGETRKYLIFPKNWRGTGNNAERYLQVPSEFTKRDLDEMDISDLKSILADLEAEASAKVESAKSKGKSKKEKSEKKPKPELENGGDVYLKDHIRKQDGQPARYIVFPKNWDGRGLNVRDRWHRVDLDFSEKDLNRMSDDELEKILKKIETNKAMRRKWIEEQKRLGLR